MGEDLITALDEVQRIADSREEYERGTLLWNMAADRAADSAWRLAAVVRAVLGVEPVETIWARRKDGSTLMRREVTDWRAAYAPVDGGNGPLSAEQPSAGPDTHGTEPR